MKLFAVGPIPMDSETLEISKEQLPYFRTKEFSKIMLECDATLKRLLGADAQTPSMYLTACGTGGLEAAVINIFTPADKLLVICGGTFGKRFAKICEIYEIPHERLEVPYGEKLTQEMLDEYNGKGFTGLLVNIHETLSGQLYDIEMLSNFCKKNQLLFVVDAISAFLVDSFQMDEYGVDAVIISSQKGLGLAPGLSMVFINQKTYEARVKNNSPKTLLLSFNDYYPEIKRGQTPYTPPIGVVIQLHEKLQRLAKVDIDEIISHSAENAAYLRKGLRELGFSYPDNNLSNGVTPVICPGEDARAIVDFLVERGIYVIPSAGELTNVVFRIGHMGLNVHKDDIDELLQTLSDYKKAKENQ